MKNQNKIACSVGILTFNSERTLKMSLDSVKDFSEIIICDGGSTDRTLPIARDYGCKIIFQDAQFKNPDNTIKNFSGARNQCLGVAIHDWFLYIDSDEAISKELVAEIKEIIEKKDICCLVYKVPSKLIIDGYIIKHSSSYPGYQYRFFNRRSGARFIKTIHERIEFDQTKFPVGTLKSPWYIVWDKEEIREYFEHSEKSIRMEALRSREQNFYQFLRWSILHNLFTTTKLFLKAFKNYLFYGFAQSMPISIEWARINYHLRLMLALSKDRLRNIN